MEHIHRGDTVADLAFDGEAFEMPSMPVPLAGLAVHPKKSTDAPKLLESLHKLEEEDPTFKILKDQQIDTIRKPVVTTLGDRISNALRKARMMGIRGLDILTGRAIAAR